jgi:signal transduction histidine kinase
MHPAAGTLDLNHNQNDIRIDFLGFWYQNPAALSFQYKLEGNDNNWVTTRDLTATYSSLAPGNYTFRVKVSDSGNFRYAREASYNFIISPPFWKTPLFYSFLAVIVVAFVYWLIQFRERSLIEANRKLERKVTERTLEIQNKNEEIQAQYEEIQAQYEEIQEQADHIRHINENLEELVMQRTAELERKNRALEEYAFINAHQLRSPVASILGLVDIMGSEESPEEQRIIISHLKQSTERLDAIVDSITKAIERKD